MKAAIWVRRVIGVFVGCFMLLLISIATQVAIGWRCDLRGEIPTSQTAPESHEGKTATAAIRDYARPEDDAYLSYPEWYIVWSYQEKADFQEKYLPSGFPYFGEVRQYWGNYCCISHLTNGRYPFNGGEQFMLGVIGTSFSAEYILKGAYERTVGRLSEWSSDHQRVEEDEYAYKVAREYADFVHVRPFYEFRFARHIAELWRDIPLSGPHPMRKWERKLFLTADFAFEALYSWVIEHGTYAAYGHEPAETYAWIKNAEPALLRQIPRVRIVKQLGPQSFIVAIPRYQEFTEVSSALVARGVQFVEIAGNSQILVSVLAPQNWRFDRTGARALFTNSILTRPGWQRVAVGCSVSALHDVLPRLNSGGAMLEHVYDY